MEKTCPYCGASLPAEASFCPRCARSIRPRREITPPKPLLGKALRAALPLALLAALALGWYLRARPRVYEGGGDGPAQVIYTDKDGTYQLLIGFPENRNQPAEAYAMPLGTDYDYTYPVRLYISHMDSGADAGKIFLQKTERVTAEVTALEGDFNDLRCDPPAPSDSSPGAALVSSHHINIRESSRAETCLTLYMKNGDVIRLRWFLTFDAIRTLAYRWQDVPMDTPELLQALLDRAAEETEPRDRVNIYLPPVEYDRPLVIEKKSVNLFGCTDGDTRTTFTAPIRIATRNDWICYFNDLDFAGGGSGVGISSSTNVFLTRCTLRNWKTGVLAYGRAWVTLIDSRVEGNEVGLHFNSTGTAVNHDTFSGNVFRNNGTAVVLESVPTDVILHFPGSLFSGNGADIDNRCGQGLDIADAVFE